MKTRVHVNYFLKVDICFFEKKNSEASLFDWIGSSSIKG